MHYELTHRTVYTYEHEVALSHHLVRLTPRELPSQRCLSHALEVVPHPVRASPRTDYFGNPTELFVIEGAHREFAVTARSRVERLPRPDPPIDHALAWDEVRELCRGDRVTVALEACEFAFGSPQVPRRPAFAAYAAPSFPPGRPLCEAVLDLTRRIHREFKFDPKATTVSTPVDQVLREKRGVCQDFAHFEIACLRSLGLPARYVSGYLETLPPPGKPKLVGADASHAWLAFFLPGSGWIDIDPTNNVLPDQRHITVAWGRDYQDVAPIRGVILSGGEHELQVAVDVNPIPPVGEPAPLPDPTEPPAASAASSEAGA